MVGVGPLVGLPHARLVVKQDNAELVCVCDIDTSAATEELGVKAYSNPQHMMEAECLDGVIIATPTHFHLPVFLELLKGEASRSSQFLRAILVEKPICESVEAAEALMEAAATAQVRVLVGHQRRHSPFAQMARRLVRSPGFGALRGITGEWALLKPASYFDCSTNPRRAYVSQVGTGGPILINLIHDVDLLRFITGREVTRVFAVASSAGRDSGQPAQVEDTAAVALTLDDGAVGTFFLSDASPSPWNYEFTARENAKYPPLPEACTHEDCYRFLGAKQALSFPSLRLFGYDRVSNPSASNPSASNPPASQPVSQPASQPASHPLRAATSGSTPHDSLPYADEPGWDQRLQMSSESVEADDPLRLQMEHFVRVCQGEEEPLCTGHDGLQALRIILAVGRSAAAQRPVCPADVVSAPSPAKVSMSPAEVSSSLALAPTTVAKVSGAGGSLMRGRVCSKL